MMRKSTITPTQFARRAADYFSRCDAEKRPYSLSALCLSLNITKRRFAALRGDADFAEAVEMALLKIEAYIEENSMAGKINGTLALAVLKESFGWGEKPPQTAERVEVLMSEEVQALAK